MKQPVRQTVLFFVFVCASVSGASSAFGQSSAGGADLSQSSGGTSATGAAPTGMGQTGGHAGNDEKVFTDDYMKLRADAEYKTNKEKTDRAMALERAEQVMRRIDHLDRMGGR